MRRGQILYESESTMGGNNNIYNGILKAINFAQKGDILAFPMSSNSRPLEDDTIIFKLFKLASECLELVIIESAGNSLLPSEINNNSDSGAIIVGAFLQDGKIKCVRSDSNFGNRVDCYAKGDGWMSIMNQDSVPYQNHIKCSAATIIITGVVAGVQSKFYSAKGRFATALELRKALRESDGEIIFRDSQNTGKKMPFVDDFIRKLGL
jgi:hypothetical protein